MKKINNNGSALAWVLMIILLTSIVVFGAQMAMIRAGNRAVAKHFERQAYLSAKGACDVLGTALKQRDDIVTGQLAKLTEGEAATIANMDFSETGMGEVTGQITRGVGEFQDVYTITCTSLVEGKTDTVSLLMHESLGRGDIIVTDAGITDRTKDAINGGVIEVEDPGDAKYFPAWAQIPEQPLETPENAEEAPLIMPYPQDGRSLTGGMYYTILSDSILSNLEDRLHGVSGENPIYLVLINGADVTIDGLPILHDSDMSKVKLIATGASTITLKESRIDEIFGLSIYAPKSKITMCPKGASLTAPTVDLAGSMVCEGFDVQDGVMLQLMAPKTPGSLMSWVPIRYE